MAGLSGKTLGGFRILEQIQDEESAQGIVCKAICEVENRSVSVSKGQVVALKVMPVRDDDRRQQWRKLEARTKELARLNHPNVVRYYGCFCEQGEWNQLHVIVQEFLEGETLKERLERFPAGLDVDEGLKIIGFALDGLAHTASKGIVHRDIKPGNIFVCERVMDGRKKLSVKLIDFEIAKQGHGSTTAATGNLRGSFNYMAPEFLDAGFRGDLLSDIFSMGVTLHETLTGKLPYDLIDGNGDDAILDFIARWKGLSDGKNPVSICPDVNRLLAHTKELFLGCLSPSREQRFCDFGDFREAIKNVRFRTLTNPASGNAYQMLQFIGKGGFGEVFKARELKNGQIVAIKHLRKAKYADRFKREARILAKFDDPCFVRFVESFSRELDGRGQEFLVMGFLEGMPGNSLWDAIRHSNGAGLPAKDVFTAFIRYARGLKMLHTAGIFHRDIKPSNLYFPAGKPERAAIMDLGIARDTKGTMTVGSVPGTPDYMPPEVVTAGSRGESGMDVYALGLCMYEALTAKTAFPKLPSDIEGFRKLVERANGKVLPRFEDVRIDADVLDLLSDMTAFNPSSRIKDVEDVERRLRGFLAKLGSPPDSESIPNMPTKRRLRIAALVGGGALVCGVLALATPWAKKIYAERRLTEVLDAYRSLAPEAVDKENAWIIEFNPQSYSWLRLEETMFAKGTNEIDVIKRQVRSNKDRQEWVARLGDCLLPDGRLAVDVFGELNARTLPAALDNEELIRGKLSELGNAVRKELGRCLSTEEVKRRRGRLKAANEILLNQWTVKVLGVDEMRRMRKAVDDAMNMCVGCIHNGCGDEVEVGGVKIGANETKTITIEDGRPERRLVTRRGYKPIPLPIGFDGMVFEVNDSTFEVKPIKVATPELAAGQRFILFDREYSGSAVLELEPGRYVGRYSRNDRAPTGEKMYKDCLVEFSVTGSEDVKIPKPGDWEHTDQYKKFLTSPVGVIIPKLEKGVVCRIDGEIVSSGQTNAASGRHLCIYEKEDYVAQTNSFDALPGKGVNLPTPLAWKPAEDLRRLQAATKLSEHKSWMEVEEVLQNIRVMADENVQELGRLKREVAAWKKAEAERIEKGRIVAVEKLAAEKRAFKTEVERLLMDEPVAGRRKRIVQAQERLAGETARKVLDQGEIEKLRNDVRVATHWVVGRIKNDCDFSFSVNGIVMRPGESRVIKYDETQTQGIAIVAKGYEEKWVAKELDESEMAITSRQWTMADVLVKLEGWTRGVECFLDGERIENEFKVKPGRYGLTLKKSGYEAQTVDLVAKIAQDCVVVEVPRNWVPLPAEVSVRELEEGVRCYLGASEVHKLVRLTPGRTYEFRYQKEDCVDQHVSVFVETGVPSVVPPPSAWVEIEDVVRLSKAESLYAEGKVNEAAALVENISVRAEVNVKRLRVLADKIKRVNALKESVELAQDAYRQGDMNECVHRFYEAHENGYILNDHDRNVVSDAYRENSNELSAQLKSVLGQIKSGVRPFRDPEAIKKDMRQLNEWYAALRK